MTKRFSWKSEDPTEFAPRDTIWLSLSLGTLSEMMRHGDYPWPEHEVRWKGFLMPAERDSGKKRVVR